MNTPTAVRLVVTMILLAACATAQGTTGSTTFTHNFSFPPTGLALTETAQVNVTSIAPASSNGTAASCTGSVSFVNSTGATIGTAASFTVGTGQVFSVSLPFARAAATGNRTEIRAVVTHTGTAPATAPCSLVFSFETYDTSTGVTHVFLGNEDSDRGR